jgi:hypothetical protein
MSSLDVLAETDAAIVLRVHGQQTAARRASVVVYVSATATAAHVAGQLRGAADELERRPGGSRDPWGRDPGMTNVGRDEAPPGGPRLCEP